MRRLDEGLGYIACDQTDEHYRYADPQKDLKIRSPRTIGGILSGLYRGYNGSI